MAGRQPTGPSEAEQPTQAAVPERSRLETSIAEHAQAGRLNDAMTAALEGYGPELLGYLYAMAPSHSEADELYATMCERLWRSLPGFRWESSFRTWAYKVARNLLRDRRRALRGPEGRMIDLADASEVARLAEKIRSTTAIHLKTEAKDQLSQVRESLDPDDRTLLILRIDRRLAWRDIAAVMHEGKADAAQLSKIAARLRKRFERLKERLREELGR